MDVIEKIKNLPEGTFFQGWASGNPGFVSVPVSDLKALVTSHENLERQVAVMKAALEGSIGEDDFDKGCGWCRGNVRQAREALANLDTEGGE